MFIFPVGTTFSAAASPVLRDRSNPRGFNPTKPRTFKGTLLVLRALALATQCHSAKVLAVAEQPRASLMSCLPEWGRLVAKGGVYETWTSS